VYKNVKRAILRIVSSQFLSDHRGALLYAVCVALLSLYMLVFQSGFTLTGDTWAEAYPEYVNDVLTKDPSDIVDSSWAGYLTIVPSFLTQIYISSPLPLGEIDYYFRAITVLFAVLCCSFIAHTFNRQFIKSDLLRIFLAFLTLVSICHVSGLAFINVWYAGFIVIILICAGSRQLSPPKELLFVLFALLICLSKPSLIVLPFVAYRLARQLDVPQLVKAAYESVTSSRRVLVQKELALKALRRHTYGVIDSILISLAITYETFLTVFGKNGFSSGSVQAGPFAILLDTLLGSGTILLKSLSLPAPHVSAIVLATVAVLVLFVSLFRRSKLLALTLGACLAFGLYLHLYSPDNTLNNVWSSFGDLYSDQTKLQRELLPTFILLFVLFMNISFLLGSKYLARKTWLRRSLSPILIVSFALIAQPWNSIITAENSHLYSVDIDNYRSSLNVSQPVCMPVAPTVFLDRSAGWFFQYRGGCYQLTASKVFSTDSFVDPLKNGVTSIYLEGDSKSELKTVILPIKSPPMTHGTIQISDTATANTYTSRIRSMPSEYQQISFNVAGLSSSEAGYSFVIESTLGPDTRLARDDNGDPVTYGLYIGKTE